MITENILSKFSSLINEDLHLDHNTKSAKIVCHVDLDGLVSGVTMFQQLKKQGIPENRITIEYAQYGDEDKNKDFAKVFSGKKNQYVGVTDFAKLPKATPFKDFNSLMNFKGESKKNLLVSFMNSRNFSNMNEENFKKLAIKTFEVVNDKFTDANLKNLYYACKAYSNLGKRNATVENIETLAYPMANPDFVSDHHSNESGALSGGKRGEIDVKSPSEGEFLANKYAPGMWSQDDLKAASMVDSAGYTIEQLKNTVFLEKHFSGSDKKKNLAILISCLYDNMVKKDREIGKWIIRHAQPSMVSLYNTTLKAINLQGKRLEYISALKEGNIEKAKELMKDYPEDLKMLYTRHGEPDKPAMNREQWIKKNTTDIENMKTGYKSEKDKNKLEEIKGKRGEEFTKIRNEINSKKGKVVSLHNFSIFDGNDKRTQYTRFATSLYSKNNQRNPFTLRYWDGMFQIAKNTLYKGTVDFKKVNDHVLEDVKKFLIDEGFSSFNVNRIIDAMNEKNGGHSGGIWMFSKFDMIKPTSKELESEKYYKAKSLKDKKIDSKLADDILARKQPIIDKYKDIKKKCMQRAIQSAIKWTNVLYPPSQEDLDKLKTTDETFNEK